LSLTAHFLKKAFHVFPRNTKKNTKRIRSGRHSLKRRTGHEQRRRAELDGRQGETMSQEKAAVVTLTRTCEAKAPGLTRAQSSGPPATRRGPGGANPPPTTPRPRPLVGGSLIGPATAKLTDMLVSKAMRVSDSSRFIRMDYTIGEQLGAGASATVRRGVCRQTGEAVAIKIFHRSDRAHALDAVREEIRVMRALSGAECCARLVAVYEDWESIYLVQEFAEGGTLTKRIAAVGRFSEKVAAVLIRGVLTALDALHRRGIAHRDVKLDNILLKSKDRQSAQYLEVRLCDFGLCRALDDCGLTSGAVGTRQFWAPEIVEGLCAGGGQRHAWPDARCDLKADMWAVGFVLFTLLFGYEPFRNENDSIMFPKILRGACIPDCPTVCPGARDLVSRLLSLDPECRPLTQEALQHQWLQQSMGQCVEDGQASDKLMRIASNCGVISSACRPSVAG
jgi:calcium/calmodulin-dependent protein kinase I